jgi:hypothetical protein
MQSVAQNFHKIMVSALCLSCGFSFQALFLLHPVPLLCVCLFVWLFCQILLRVSSQLILERTKSKYFVFSTACFSSGYSTGSFIMFSVITNIYNKKIKGPTLMELFTATGKLKKFFWQLETFDVLTTGDTAHIDTIFNFLPHTRQHGSGRFLTTYTRIA